MYIYEYSKNTRLQAREMTKLIWNGIVKEHCLGSLDVEFASDCDKLACRILIRGFLLGEDPLFAKLFGFCLFSRPGLAVVLAFLLFGHLTPLLERLLVAVVVRQALLWLVPAVGWLVLALVGVLGLLVLALILLVGVALLVACGLPFRLRAKVWLSLARCGLVCRSGALVEVVVVLPEVEEF